MGREMDVGTSGTSSLDGTAALKFGFQFASQFSVKLSIMRDHAPYF
jgi:hypothetical protein